MKKLIITTTILGVFNVISANAACVTVGVYQLCYTYVDCDEYADKITLDSISGCAAYGDSVCYNRYSYDSSTGTIENEYYGSKSCSTCRRNYAATSTTFPSLPNSYQMNNTITTCQWQGCDVCTANKDWGAYRAGYEIKTPYACNEYNQTCTPAITIYRCAAGYYKSGTSVQCTLLSGLPVCSGCTQCPQATDVWTDAELTNLAYGTSIPGEATSESDCYLSGTYYDATGKFTISDTSCTY